jgi:hypothetical protein
LDAVEVNVSPTTIFTAITKQRDDKNKQETYTLHKHGLLIDFIQTQANQAVYRGTGFFTAKLSGRDLVLTLAGTASLTKPTVYSQFPGMATRRKTLAFKTNYFSMPLDLPTCLWNAMFRFTHTNTMIHR